MHQMSKEFLFAFLFYAFCRPTCRNHFRLTYPGRFISLFLPLSAYGIFLAFRSDRIQLDQIEHH